MEGLIKLFLVVGFIAVLGFAFIVFPFGIPIALIVWGIAYINSDKTN